MNVYQSIKNTVSNFFGLWKSDSNSNNQLAGNKRRCISSEESENIAPKRLKRFHTQTQTDVGGVGISQLFPSRSEKLQFMTRIGSVYTPSSTLSVGPRSWHISMDKNVTELSSDEEYSDDNEVQIVGEEPVRGRNPLSSIAAKNDLASSSHKDNDVEVVKVFKKGKELQKNGTQSQLVNQHSSSLANFSHRKSSNFNLSSFKKDSRKNRSAEAPKVTTLFMAIEMDSKQRYRALLDSFRDTTSISSSTALKSPQSFANLQDVETKCKLTSPLTRKTNMAKVDVIDLTKQNEKRRPTRLHVKSRTDDGDDSDVEILSVKPVSRVNSCEQRCQTSRFYDDNFLKEMNKKWENKMKEIQQEVEEEQVKKKLYAKYNRSRQINDVEDRVRRCMIITDSIVLDEPVEEDKDQLPELTKEMEEKIAAALVPKPPNEVVSEGFSLRITRRDMTTLAKLNWLNDEVINFYMNLLIERGKRENMPKVYAFNTFFYPQLIDRGFTSLKRWTRKVDIFAHDLIAVPVHLGVHWCMAIIDFRNKIVEYYDSMGQSNDRCLSALLKYLEHESLDKKNTPYDTSTWKTKNMSNIPQQMNGSDCGMFACTFAEYKCRNGKINFSQNDMPYFRRKMVYEILTGRLMMGN